MRRAGWIATAIAGWTVVCGATRGVAQAPSPEGWLVLSIEEYLSLRDRSLGVGPPPSAGGPRGRARLLVRRSGGELWLSGGFVADYAEATTESRWTMFGRPNEPLKLSWKPRVDDRRATLPLRIRARLTELIGFAE